MADKKLKIALGAGVAVVAILMALLLSTCSGKAEPAPTEPVQTQPATEMAETQATELPTEVPTEATEIATEPTEPEETEASSGGSSTPGGQNSGSGSSSSDDDDDKPEETEPFEAPAAGAENNPYVEVLGKNAETINTVNLKANESVYYEIYGVADTVLVLDDQDATLTVDKTACQRDENGLIKLPIGADAKSVILQLTNTGKEETAFQLRFARRGSAENPEKLESIESIAVELTEGDEDGYHYVWTATDTCELTLKPAKTGYRILATMGGKTVSNADSADGSLTLQVNAGTEVLLQTIATEDEEGNYPAVSDVITCDIPEKGSLKNPIVLDSLTPAALELAGGEDHARYYSWTPEMSGTFTVQVTGIEPDTAGCGVTLDPETMPTDGEETPAPMASKEVEAGKRVLIRLETAPDRTIFAPATILRL